MLTTIDPINRAATIIDHDPTLAEPLFDLICFIIECNDPRNNSQVDRVLEMVYARTEDGTKHRQTYKNRRIRSPSPEAEDQQTHEATIAI
jgi:hypothetical protein